MYVQKKLREVKLVGYVTYELDGVANTSYYLLLHGLAPFHESSPCFALTGLKRGRKTNGNSPFVFCLFN